MKKRSVLRIKAILALVFVMTAWGVSFVSSKIVIENIPPVSAAALRFILAGTLMVAALPFFSKNDTGKSGRFPKELMPALIISALTGVTFYFIFENFGLYYTTASSGALITSSIPVLALLFEMFFMKRKILSRQIWGVAISLAGVYLLTRGGSPVARAPLLGNLLVLGSCVCWVLFNFFSIKLQKTLSTFSVTAWQNFYGALFLLPVAFFERSQWKAVSLDVWLHLLYLVFVCSILCYFFYNFALRGVGSVTAGAFINLIPLVGAFSGVIILHETISFSQIVGGILVLGCIALIMDFPSKSKVMSSDLKSGKKD